jgi:hypothetical protein
MPLWSRSGHELAYETRDGRLMMGSYAVNGDTFIPGKPRPWSTQQILITGNGNDMDLAPDGKHFAVLIAQQSNEPRSTGGVRLLLNFFDDLKQRVPSGGK